MMGQSAPRDDPRWAVAMCWHHNVDSPPSKALRQAERSYLEAMYRDRP